MCKVVVACGCQLTRKVRRKNASHPTDLTTAGCCSEAWLFLDRLIARKRSCQVNDATPSTKNWRCATTLSLRFLPWSKFGGVTHLHASFSWSFLWFTCSIVLCAFASREVLLSWRLVQSASWLVLWAWSHDSGNSSALHRHGSSVVFMNCSCWSRIEQPRWVKGRIDTLEAARLDTSVLLCSKQIPGQQVCCVWETVCQGTHFLPHAGDVFLRVLFAETAAALELQTPIKRRIRCSMRCRFLEMANALSAVANLCKNLTNIDEKCSEIVSPMCVRTLQCPDHADLAKRSSPHRCLDRRCHSNTLGKSQAKNLSLTASIFIFRWLEEVATLLKVTQFWATENCGRLKQITLGQCQQKACEHLFLEWISNLDLLGLFEFHWVKDDVRVRKFKSQGLWGLWTLWHKVGDIFETLTLMKDV